MIAVTNGDKMKKWYKSFQEFYSDKRYVLVLILTAVCAYGFMVTHSAVGIDDTPYDYYFEEGLAAIVGRWVLYLLNKIVHVADYAPFLTDFAGVLILMAAVTVWAVLFRSVLTESAVANNTDEKNEYVSGVVKNVPWYGYLFFAAIFLSCPLISEVYTYYLHNGIAIGYLCSGISLCCFREGLNRLDAQSGKRLLPGWQACKAFVGAVIGMWIAMGCYESFMIVWLQGLCLILFTERFAGVRRRVFHALCIAAVIAVLGMTLRSVMINLVTAVFGLEYLKEEAVQRSIGELAGWILEPGAMSELAMVLKRMFVMYGVFAYAYYPIKIFLIAAIIIGLFGLWQGIAKKDIWAVLLMVGGLAVPLLLVVIEGKATYYRSAQFLPLVCGYGSLVAVYAVNILKKTKLTAVLHGAVILMLCCVIWNQCADMNKWFYVDYLKYESAKELAGNISYALEQKYDTTKPVVFTGTYDIPESIIEDAYVSYSSETFFKMKRITDMVDGHLLEKFYRSYGVWVAQTPALSVIDWARYAFDNNEEMVRFFAMHGYDIVPMLDESIYPVAEEYSLNLPSFPQEGSIVDMGEYIIVHF